MIDKEYVKLLNRILTEGEFQQDRTSIGNSKQLFGQTIDFDTENKYAPLLQVRTMTPRIAFEEWKWMMNGSTDVTELQKKNIHIWDDNSTREFLDARGLYDVPENNINKAYGYQYRSFGGDADQIKNVFNSLRDNPTSRRHLITIWNPNELHEMALEPCFWAYNFVYINGTLNLEVTSRSSDVVFGLPYNLAWSYFFLYSFAKALGYKTGKIRLNLANAHIYENQLELVNEILKQDLDFGKPRVTLEKDIKELDDILNLEFADFSITDWVKGPVLIKDVKMAV
jgi:thymidylate synthase